MKNAFRIDKETGLGAFSSSDALAVDTRKMLVTARISTSKIDHSRDRVNTLGIDTSVHQKNPLVLLQHAKGMANPPIGRSEDESGQYSVKLFDNEAIATVKLFDNNLDSEQAFSLVEMGALNGASIGFLAYDWGCEGKRDNAGIAYTDIKNCILLEWSLVFVPDNPDALVLAYQKHHAGKPLSNRFKELIEPMIPKKKSLTQGVNLLRSGKMNDDDSDDSTDMDSKADDVGAVKPGAQALAGCYSMAMEFASYVSDTVATMEDDRVIAAMTDAIDTLASLAESLATVFEEAYPDMPPLREMADDDASADADDSMDDDEKKKKALRNRLLKQAKAWTSRPSMANAIDRAINVVGGWRSATANYAFRKTANDLITQLKRAKTPLAGDSSDLEEAKKLIMEIRTKLAKKR